MKQRHLGPWVRNSAPPASRSAFAKSPRPLAASRRRRSTEYRPRKRLLVPSGSVRIRQARRSRSGNLAWLVGTRRLPRPATEFEGLPLLALQASATERDKGMDRQRIAAIAWAFDTTAAELAASELMRQAPPMPATTPVPAARAAKRLCLIAFLVPETEPVLRNRSGRVVLDVEIIRLRAQPSRYDFGACAAFSVPAETNPLFSLAKIDRPCAMRLQAAGSILIWTGGFHPACGTRLELLVARSSGSRLWAGRP